MKHITLATAVALMLATSASAGGFGFVFPTLTFAPTAETTVAKDCLPTTDVTVPCPVQE